MTANQIRAKLLERGIRLSDVARICNTSRQNVSMAINSQKGRWGKQAIILDKIYELINNRRRKR